MIIFGLLILITILAFLFHRYKNKLFGEAEIKERKTGILCVFITIALLWIIVPLFCFERIAPGEVGVVVDMFGSDKGVEQAELTVGYHFILPTKTLYRFPIFEQNHQWEKEEGFSFQTSEGLSVKADIGITYNLVPSRINELFCKYRRGMDEITHLFIRNNIRDAINRYASRLKIEDLYGPAKESFFKDVLTDVNNELQPLGFNISHIYTVGQLDVPDNVKEALNKKIEAIQRAQQRENELREAEAEAKKVMANMEGVSKAKIIEVKAEAESITIKAKANAESMMIRAKAESAANEMISKSLDSNQLQWEALKKWDGKLPEVMSGDNMPFLLNRGK